MPRPQGRMPHPCQPARTTAHEDGGCLATHLVEAISIQVLSASPMTTVPVCVCVCVCVFVRLSKIGLGLWQGTCQLLYESKQFVIFSFKPRLSTF